MGTVVQYGPHEEPVTYAADTADTPDKAPQVEPLLLSIKDVAKCLSLSTATIRHLLESGRLPDVRIGSRRLVRYTDVKAFVDSLPTKS